jgi:hypothetical protein
MSNLGSDPNATPATPEMTKALETFQATVRLSERHLVRIKQLSERLKILVAIYRELAASFLVEYEAAVVPGTGQINAILSAEQLRHDMETVQRLIAVTTTDATDEMDFVQWHKATVDADYKAVKTLLKGPK